MAAPLFVSFYTKNTLYEKDAARLKSSCETWGLEHCIEGIEPFGKWNQHTLYKAKFIAQKMEQYKRPLVWLDADSEVVQKPILFDHLTCDMAIKIYDNFPPRSSVLLFRRNHIF